MQPQLRLGHSFGALLTKREKKENRCKDRMWIYQAGNFTWWPRMLTFWPPLPECCRLTQLIQGRIPTFDGYQPPRGGAVARPGSSLSRLRSHPSKLLWQSWNELLAFPSTSLSSKFRMSPRMTHLRIGLLECLLPKFSDASAPGLPAQFRLGAIHHALQRGEDNARVAGKGFCGYHTGVWMFDI